MSGLAPGLVAAVLGPTNTGKTYFAIDRMLGHASGMIGFPLRLLARENYDRVVRLKGLRQVALVTGEEKIVPPGARYFLCTVESMPVDRPVGFLAVDEIQLCGDPERGHVFTDRLLHARGLDETMFLGAETVRPVLRRLVPEARLISRPRFSILSYAGTRKLTRLPPRSAVVAFAAAEVYAMAELLRRRRGGTAVVLGALSPRTRNAQVGMFEAGEVDYLVATDAIGMGLNLDLDHVAFARLEKFDGRTTRRLSAPEIAQIAGRAGRHMADGTFGTTPEAGALAPELVEAIENHRFEPLRVVYWRSRQLDFASPAALLRSLEQRPPAPELLGARETDDLRALQLLARDPAVAARASHRGAVRLLWEVCQIPDFQNILSDDHARLLGRIYGLLMGQDGRLPEDWVARQIARIDRVDGDIEALTGRIANVRTWAYVSHRADWIADPGHWQERAREVEDRLSEALHQQLTQRFVDRRAATLVRRLKSGDDLLAAIRLGGEVLVEGERLGRLEGFRFRLDGSIEGEDARPLLAAARRALGREIPARVRQLEADGDDAFTLEPDGRIAWRGVPVARLARGDKALQPAVEPLASEFLDGRARERLRRRLSAWLRGYLETCLAPLVRLAETQARQDLNAPLRGVLFQLVEALGLVPRAACAVQIKGLTRADRRALRLAGVRLGRESVFVPALLKPASRRLGALLWAVHAGAPALSSPPSGARVFAPQAGTGAGLCHALGFRYLNGAADDALAVRADVLERVSAEARRLAAPGGFVAGPGLSRLVRCSENQLAVILGALGYRVRRDAEGVTFAAPNRRRAGRAPGRPAKKTGRAKSRTRAADSPFAKLRGLSLDK